MYPTSVGVWAMPIPPPVRVRGETPHIYFPHGRGVGQRPTYTYPSCRGAGREAPRISVFSAERERHAFSLYQLPAAAASAAASSFLFLKYRQTSMDISIKLST